MRELRALKILDFQAIRNRLGLCCETELGKQLASELFPEFDRESVWRLIHQTSEALDLFGKNPPPSLYGVFDVRPALKLAGKGSILGGQELYRIGVALQGVRSYNDYLEPTQSPTLSKLAIGLIPEPKIEAELIHCLDSDGSVQDDASSELAEIRRKKRGAQGRILERIQAYVSGKARDYLSDPLYTVREGRYVIPLKSEHKGKIRGIIHDTSATGSTLYLEPDDVIAAANDARQIEAAEREEEKRILTLLSRKLAHISDATVGSLTLLGELDLIFAKARLAAQMKANVPEEVPGNFIKIQGGRHPMLDPETVVPIDIEVGKDANVLITGPNTGGKTVAMKTVGLFVAMMQSGLMPPAIHVKFGSFSQIWADIGDEQSIEQSLSTFSAHVKNIASALNNLQPGGLVLLDEVGAGTDPAEGAALAQAILLEIQAKEAVVLASTHYGELKAFAFSEKGFTNASMEFDAKSLRPTYRLILGAAGASQALKIAERYGIKHHVIERAIAGLTDQQQNLAEMLHELENSQKRARAAQSEADRRTAELRDLELKAERKLKEAEDIRKRANERSHDAIETTLREIRIQAEDVIESLKKQGVADPQKIQKSREDLRALDALGKDLSRKFKQEPKAIPAGSKTDYRKGDVVQVLGFQQNAVLLEDSVGKEVFVQMGALKMKVDVRKLSPTQQKLVSPSSNKSKMGLSKTMTATTEITLRNMRAEDAVQLLERFLDDAILGNVPWVRIVHGKGEGILRQITQDYLKKHPEVKNFRDGDATEGGQGVTIATFR